MGWPEYATNFGPGVNVQVDGDPLIQSPCIIFDFSDEFDCTADQATGTVTVALAGGALSASALDLTDQTDASAAATATMTNAPVAGNASYWYTISIDGVPHYCPAWEVP